MTSTCAHVTEPHSSLLAGIYKSGSPGSVGYQVLLSRYSLMVAGRCAPFTPSSSSFPYSAGPSTKSCTGLMEWADQEAVLDVFVLTNHQTIYSQSMPSSFSSLLVQHMRTSHSLWSSSLPLPPPPPPPFSFPLQMVRLTRSRWPSLTTLLWSSMLLARGR